MNIQDKIKKILFRATQIVEVVDKDKKIAKVDFDRNKLLKSIVKTISQDIIEIIGEDIDTGNDENACTHCWAHHYDCECGGLNDLRKQQRKLAKEKGYETK